MKRLLTVYLLACALSGAAEILWTEGFEGTFPPPGWIENSVDQSTSHPFNESTNNAKLGAEADFLITPKITVGQTLVFWSYTTPADPDIITEYASSTSGPWTEFPESPFSGYTDQWNGRWVDLSTLPNIYVRFQKSGGGSLYIDDVSLEDGVAVSNQPPVLAPVGDKTIFENDTLSFTVTADDPVDGDPITLIATNLPTGATFATNGLFVWSNAVPSGAYAVTFTATDKDGSDNETITITVLERPKLLISEVADPSGTGGDAYRFVELYNPGTNTIDLATNQWFLGKQVNGGTWHDIPLAGTVAPSEAWVIANGATDFETAYGFAPDQESGTVSGNGDDAYFLYYGGDHTSGTLIDAYGEFDTDGTDAAWDYEDSRAVRNNNILAPNNVWTAPEWTIDSGATTNNMTPGEHGPTPEFEELNDVFVWMGDDLNLTVTTVNTVRTDVITLSATNLPAGATFPTTIGTDTVSSMLSWETPTAGAYTVTFKARGDAGTTTKSITVTVSRTTQLDRCFYGWKSDTIVKLKNGQFWRNTGGVSDPINPPLRNPDITITNPFGSRRMFVENVTGYKTVELIEIAENTVTNTFTGLHNGNLYQLENGTKWSQISYENISSSASPVTAWRWTDDGKTTLRFLDRNDVVIGTCQVEPASPPVNSPIISLIDGWFRGWKNNRIFALANGQFWQQIDLDHSTETLYRPATTLTNWLQSGIWRMQVEGAATPPTWIEVQQITNVTRTAIDGGFHGFGLRNFFHMQNGSWWRQTSIDTSTSTRSNPEVIIWDDHGTHVLEMPDEGRSVEAEELTVYLESTITNAFPCLHYGNLYRPDDDSDWLQISFETANINLVDPEIMLWIESGETHMVVRSENDETIGTCVVTDPEADTDGDQTSNAAEIIAGTDLLNAQSKFEITQTTRDGTGQTILQWDAVEDKTYTIEWTPVLGELFQPLETNILWPQNSWTDTVHTVETQGFYRINVRLAD